MKKTAKIFIVTLLCLTLMTVSVYAYTPSSTSMSPVGVLLNGDLTTSTDIYGGRPVGKHFTVTTTTSITVKSITVSYIIKQKGSDDVANVHDYSMSRTTSNTDRISLSWDSQSTAEIGTTHVVYGTHEFNQGGTTYVVYTSDEL